MHFIYVKFISNIANKMSKKALVTKMKMSLNKVEGEKATFVAPDSTRKTIERLSSTKSLEV